MAVQRSRSERRGESYSVPYVEPLSDARTKLADFFSIVLGRNRSSGRNPGQKGSSLICPSTHILERNALLRCQVKQRPHFPSRPRLPLIEIERKLLAECPLCIIAF